MQDVDIVNGFCKLLLEWHGASIGFETFFFKYEGRKLAFLFLPGFVCTSKGLGPVDDGNRPLNLSTRPSCAKVTGQKRKLFVIVAVWWTVDVNGNKIIHFCTTRANTKIQRPVLASRVQVLSMRRKRRCRFLTCQHQHLFILPFCYSVLLVP